MAFLSVLNLIKKFDSIPAVDNISFEADKGEFLTLLGPSGCGKTTTLRCIAGLEKSDQGEIYIGDKMVVSTTKNIFVEPDKRGLGMVFQSYAIWPHLTVFNNIAYPLKERKLKKHIIREKVLKILDMVKLSGFEDRSATKLSGGQQQRVALARALVYDPEVLLFDEPLSNLDAKLRIEMRNEIRNLQKNLGI
jgi:iron(III) transport system ATP-binding protein